MYEYVLNAVNTAEIPEKIKVCLISRLSLELNKISTEQLIKFINMCKKDIEYSNENCIQRYVQFGFPLSCIHLGDITQVNESNILKF